MTIDTFIENLTFELTIRSEKYNQIPLKFIIKINDSICYGPTTLEGNKVQKCVGQKKLTTVKNNLCLEILDPLIIKNSWYSPDNTHLKILDVKLYGISLGLTPFQSTYYPLHDKPIPYGTLLGQAGKWIMPFESPTVNYYDLIL